MMRPEAGCAVLLFFLHYMIIMMMIMIISYYFKKIKQTVISYSWMDGMQILSTTHSH